MNKTIILAMITLCLSSLATAQEQVKREPTPEEIAAKAEAEQKKVEDEESFLADLRLLELIPSHEDIDKVPRFANIRIRVAPAQVEGTEEGVRAEEKLLPIEYASQKEIADFYRIIIDPKSNLEAAMMNYVLDSQSNQELGDEMRVLNGRHDIDAKTRDAMIIATSEVFYVPAAKAQLLWLTYFAHRNEERGMAAAQLVQALSLTNDRSVIDKISAKMMYRVLSSCHTFVACFQTISSLSAFVDASPDEVLAPDLVLKLKTSIASISKSNKFLGQLLLFRFQTLLIQSKLLLWSGMSNVSQSGRQPKLTAEQIAEIRADIDANIGVGGVWQTAAASLRQKYNNREVDESAAFEERKALGAPSDLELMAAALTDHLALQLSGAGLALLEQDGVTMKPIFAKRADQKEQEILNYAGDNPDELYKQQLLQSLPGEIASGFYQTYYNNLATRYYLKRFEVKDVATWLTKLDSFATAGNLFDQDLLEPVSVYIMLAYYAKWELKLPHRHAWLKTLKVYANSKNLADIANDPKKEPVELEPVGVLWKHIYDTIEKLKSGEIAMADLPANFEIKYLDPDFIEKQVIFTNLMFHIYDAEILRNIDIENLQQYWGLRKGLGPYSPVQIEQWAARQFPDFESLHFQLARIQDAKDDYQNAYAHLGDIEKVDDKDKFYAQEVVPQYHRYLHRLLTTACYAYWLPLNSEGKNFSQAEIASMKIEDMVKAKPMWQATYSFKKAKFREDANGDFDLRKACGESMKVQIPIAVQEYLNFKINENLATTWPQILGQEGAFYAGDILMTLMASRLTGALSSVFRVQEVSRFATRAAFRKSFSITGFGLRHYAVRNSVAAAGFFGRYMGLSNRLIYRLSRQMVRNGFSASLNLTTFIMARKIITNTMNLREYVSGMSSDKKVLQNLEIFLENVKNKNIDPDKSAWQNFVANFGTEFAYGLPMFMIIPAMNNLAFRQAYTGKMTGKIADPLQRKHIEHYFKTRGLQRYIYENGEYKLIANKAGYTIAEHGAYVALPAVYSMGTFVTVPLVGKAVNVHVLHSQNEVIPDWRLFLSQDVASAGLLTSVFTSLRLFGDWRFRVGKMETAKRIMKTGGNLDEVNRVWFEGNRFELYDSLGLPKPTLMRPNPVINTATLTDAYTRAVNRGIAPEKASEAAQVLGDPARRIAYDKQEWASGVRSFGLFNGVPRDVEIVTRTAAGTVADAFSAARARMIPVNVD